MNIEINHVLVRTHDLKNMILFFKQTVGLEEGFRPPFDFPGAWLYSNDKPLIHLVEINPDDKGQADYLGNQELVSDIRKGAVDHISFSGCNYSELIKRLKQQQIEYFERTVPLSNEHQVFVMGSDGLKLELLFKADDIYAKK